MTYALRVQNPGGEDSTVWNNFWDYLIGKYDNYIPPEVLDKELAEFGAVNVRYTSFIRFELQEDATAFTLRFS